MNTEQKKPQKQDDIASKMGITGNLGKQYTQYSQFIVTVWTLYAQGAEEHMNDDSKLRCRFPADHWCCKQFLEIKAINHVYHQSSS